MFSLHSTVIGTLVRRRFLPSGTVSGSIFFLHYTELIISKINYKPVSYLLLTVCFKYAK